MLSGRPAPSLRMRAAKPVGRGCVPVAGFQALCAQPNAAWGTPEWEQAAKTTVSTWGRAFVGPQADDFWVRSVDADPAARRLIMQRRKEAHRKLLAQTTVSVQGGVNKPSSAVPDTKREHEVGHEHAGDTPLPVGMQGTVQVFGWILCTWAVEFGRETLMDDHGNVESRRSGPMFALHPVGQRWRWFAVGNLRKSFKHPKECLGHLAQQIDAKLKMDGALEQKAKTIDPWGLFAMRDDAVADFLQTHFAPTRADTLDETTLLLAHRRKRTLVNGYLIDMLGSAEESGCSRTSAFQASPDPLHLSHGHEHHSKGQDRELIARRPDAASFCAQSTVPPSFIPPRARKGDPPTVKSAVWRHVPGRGWEKDETPRHSQLAAQKQTRGLDTASPFMPLEVREREERRRVREGREGPGSARQLKMQKWQERDVQRFPREREPVRQQCADGVADEMAVLAPLLHTIQCSRFPTRESASRASGRLLGASSSPASTHAQWSDQRSHASRHLRAARVEVEAKRSGAELEGFRRACRLSLHVRSCHVL